jgi:hypothetical protein
MLTPEMVLGPELQHLMVHGLQLGLQIYAYHDVPLSCLQRVGVRPGAMVFGT